MEHIPYKAQDESLMTQNQNGGHKKHDLIENRTSKGEEIATEKPP